MRPSRPLLRTVVDLSDTAQETAPTGDSAIYGLADGVGSSLVKRIPIGEDAALRSIPEKTMPELKIQEFARGTATFNVSPANVLLDRQVVAGETYLARPSADSKLLFDDFTRKDANDAEDVDHNFASVSVAIALPLQVLPAFRAAIAPYVCSSFSSPVSM